MQGLFLVQSFRSASSRYRVLQYLPYLRERGLSCDVEEVARTLRGRWRQLGGAAEYDFVFLQRKLLPAFWLWRLRRAARKLVFDFDDAIMFRSSSRSDPRSRGRMRAFSRTVRAADRVLCGNRFLHEQCAAVMGEEPRRSTAGISDEWSNAGLRFTGGLTPPARRAVVVPTVVDADRYPLHQSAGDGTVTLGWIGSRSTLRYLEALRPVLEELGRTRPNVRLKVVCDAFPRFTHLPVVRVPWSEATETAEVASFDVGLMPLSADVWSQGKCGLKILQYQAAGVPCVATPVGVNAEFIESHATGFPARSAAEWLAALGRLIDDPLARRRMGRAARTRLVECWSLAAWQPRMLDLLQKLVQESPAPSASGAA
ncbi:MAG: glycosyltransferase [Planctomycetales bacterium]